MSDPVIFQIEQGEIGLLVVDKNASGYLDAWQAPGGKTVDAVALADYAANSGAWTCQVTAGALTASPNTTTQDVPATFCSPAKSVPTPGETSYSVDLSFLQDPNVAAGLSAYLYEFDTQEAYVYFGMDDGNPPRMIGRVRLAAGTIGGDARATLTADASLPLVRRPDIEFGDATTSRIVLGATGTPATGATAGTPGTWTPAGSTPPASPAAMSGVTASPATAWTTGQYVQTQTAGAPGQAHWTGSAWVSGAALATGAQAQPVAANA